MALRKTVTKTLPGFAGVLTAENAYWKIVSISGSKDVIDFTVAAFVEGSQVYGSAHSFQPSVTENSGNFIQQAYDHLKTLPEFVDAVDC